MKEYPLWYNEDGTVGKQIPLGSHGFTIQVNDARLVPGFMQMQRELEEYAREFDHFLINKGVKAYRPNDGNVDRENCKVTFYVGETETGYYWSNQNLKLRDKIFIGSKMDGGRFAEITHVYEPIRGICRKYGYKPISETIPDESGRPFYTHLNYKLSFWEKLFGYCKVKLQDDIAPSLDYVHIPEPEIDDEELLKIL